jgi:pimeloyl-ACP methyl ester carboxylesterase
MLFLFLLILAGCLLVLWRLTAFGVARIERANPPGGQMITVGGGRLHVVELGANRPGPPIVLLHGASGNLADMRIALGEKLAARHRVILIDRPGHGWSERWGGDADASPGRQAALVAQVLDRLGAQRPIIVGHSWAGALATAYALAYPERISGLMLISAVTHPWPGGIAWYYRLCSTPIVGPLFAHTVVLPLGLALLPGAIESVFSPQHPPPDYIRRASITLVLRPSEFLANARDVAELKAFVTAQAPHYADIMTPTIVITGDLDRTVSPHIHSQAIAAALPHAKLIILPGVGHMPHHSESEIVVRALDELAADATSAPARALP